MFLRGLEEARSEGQAQRLSSQHLLCEQGPSPFWEKKGKQNETRVPSFHLPHPQARVSLKKAESCACSKPAEQQSNSQKVGQFKVPVSTATSSQTIWVAGAFSLRSHFFSPPQIAFFLYY